MLEIRIAEDNSPLDLFSNTAINIEKESPLFAEDLPVETYSYPVDLPSSSTNRRLLGFPNMPESTVDLGEIPVTLYIHGSSFTGLLNILRASAKKITVAIVVKTIYYTHLEKSIKYIGFGEPIICPTIQTLVTEAENSVTANVDSCPFCFPPYSNTKWSPSPINNWITGSNTYNAVAPMVPFYYLTFVLSKIADLMKLGLKGNFINDEEIKTLCIYNMHNVFSTNTSLSPKNHLPDMSIREFIIAIKRMFGLCIYVEQNSLVFQYKKRPIHTDVQADWTNIAEPSWIVEKHKTNEGYSLVMQTEPNDEITPFLQRNLNNINGVVGATSALPIGTVGDIYFVRNIQRWAQCSAPSAWRMLKYIGYAHKMVIGNGQETIETAAGTLPMDFTLGIGADLLMPIAKQENDDNDSASFGLRLLFYRGLQATSTPALLAPMASSDIYDYNGSQIGQYSLMWCGQNGLYKTFHEDWLTMRENAKSVTFTLNLNITKLLNIDIKKPVLIDRNIYLIEKINIQYTASSVGICTARMVRV